MPAPSEYNFGLEPENPISLHIILLFKKCTGPKTFLEPFKSFGLQVLISNSPFLYWQRVINASIDQIQQLPLTLKTQNCHS